MVNAIEQGIESQIRADKFDYSIIAKIEYVQGSNVLAELKKAQETAAKCHEENSTPKRIFIKRVEWC